MSPPWRLGLDLLHFCRLVEKLGRNQLAGDAASVEEKSPKPWRVLVFMIRTRLLKARRTAGRQNEVASVDKAEALTRLPQIARRPNAESSCPACQLAAHHII